MTLLAIMLTAMLGSLHCAAMCGGLVLACGPGRGVAAYQAGRLLAYTTLGAAAGGLGSALNLAGSTFLGIQRAAGVVLGVVLIGMALRALRPRPSVRRRAPGDRIPLFDRLRARMLRVPFATGLLSGLLPCGWLWGFVVLAGSQGSAMAGVQITAAFWLGTVPMLAAFGLFARGLSLRLSRYAPRLTAALMLCAGLLTVAGKVGPTFEAPATPSSNDDCAHPSSFTSVQPAVSP